MLQEVKLRLMARIPALCAFTLACALGRLGVWAAAFIAGLVIEAIKPGRLYCMWLCPVRAAHGLAGMDAVARKEKGGTQPWSKAMRAFGRVFIAMFLLLFGISLALGLRGWLFPSLVALGVVISCRRSLQGFCSNMCPLGAAFIIIRRGSLKITGSIENLHRRLE
jgi:polyferredoxin